MSELTDNELMLLVKTGELDKMSLLFRRHHRSLYNFLYHMTHDREASEDMVQNVFYRMLKYRNTYTGKGEFVTWMFHLGRNVLKDKFKKQKQADNYNGLEAISDITGETEVNNPNGSITLTNVSGSAVATSVSGNITVTFASVTENSPMAFSTLIGKIDVTFPPLFKANMKIQSDEGGLFRDYDILFEGTTPKISKVNMPPLYRTKLAGKLTGKINGGGAEILMKIMMGNIYIRKSK